MYFTDGSCDTEIKLSAGILVESIVPYWALMMTLFSSSPSRLFSSTKWRNAETAISPLFWLIAYVDLSFARWLIVEVDS